MAATTAIATDVTTPETVTGDTVVFGMQTGGPAAIQCTTTTTLAGTAVTSGTTAKLGIASSSTSVLMADIGVGLQSQGADAGDFILVDLRIAP